MPNHIKTVLRVKDLGSTSLQNVHAKLLNDKRHVDFNCIEPMPSCLEGFNPHHGVINVAESTLKKPLDSNPLLSRLQKHNRDISMSEKEQMSEKDKAMVERAINNHKACGYIYWYEWACDKWGTKWNAYGQPDDGFAVDSVEFYFETAWAHPKKLIAKASAFLPEVTFEILYADEDTGSNCGTYTIKGGGILEQDIAPSYSEQTDEQKKKFTKFAFELNNPDTDPRSHGYDENWQYSDEVYEAYESSQAA